MKEYILASKRILVFPWILCHDGFHVPYTWPILVQSRCAVNCDTTSLDLDHWKIWSNFPNILWILVLSSQDTLLCFYVLIFSYFSYEIIMLSKFETTHTMWPNYKMANMSDALLKFCIDHKSMCIECHFHSSLLLKYTYTYYIVFNAKYLRYGNVK